MACFHPIKGNRGPDGTVTFSRSGPHWIDKPITVACGQCIGCRVEKTRQWAVRSMHESQMHEKNCFITLTYSDAHLPPDETLVLDHWKNFAKKFRRDIGPFRYVHCGEYGELNHRPHYHASIFGHDFSSDREHYRTTPRGDQLYTSPTLDKLWGKGICVIGELTFETAGYVAGYIMKKITGDAGARYYNTIDYSTGEVLAERKPPYITMSRRPGIGAGWIEKYTADVYPRDEVVINGAKMRPPKFYDNYLDQAQPEVLKQIKGRRAAAGSIHEDNNTPERLAVRKEVLTQKRKTFNKREL